MAASAEGPRPVARPLCDVRALVAEAGETARVRWKLAEPGRQLDANVVHLPPDGRVPAHAEPDLDVLLYVVAGDGALTSDEGPEPLAEGTLCWLPRGSTRQLQAGPGGLSYVTVHTRRPGMRIGRGPAPGAGA